MNEPTKVPTICVRIIMLNVPNVYFVSTRSSLYFYLLHRPARLRVDHRREYPNRKQCTWQQLITNILLKDNAPPIRSQRPDGLKGRLTSSLIYNRNHKAHGRIASAFLTHLIRNHNSWAKCQQRTSKYFSLDNFLTICSHSSFQKSSTVFLRGKVDNHDGTGISAVNFRFRTNANIDLE